MRKLITSLNVPKTICTHVLGKNHTKTHRRYCGICVMIVGVFIAEVIGGTSHYLTFICNVFGYGLHGMGLVPFIEED